MSLDRHPVFNYVAGAHDAEKAIIVLENTASHEVGAHEQVHEKSLPRRSTVTCFRLQCAPNAF
jgi:hypothetical protein